MAGLKHHSKKHNQFMLSIDKPTSKTKNIQINSQKTTMQTLSHQSIMIIMIEVQELLINIRKWVVSNQFCFFTLTNKHVAHVAISQNPGNLGTL
jgi:hypothetical protein